MALAPHARGRRSPACAGQLVEVAGRSVAGPARADVHRPRRHRRSSSRRDRIRAAVQNSGVEWPNRADHRRAAAGRSAQGRLALRPGLAIAVLAAAGGCRRRGRRRGVDRASWAWTAGCDRCAACCRRSSRPARPASRRVVVASANAAEATLVDTVDVRVADNLAQVLGWLQGPGRRCQRPSRARTPESTVALRTWPTLRASRPPSERSKSPPRAATTSTSSVPPARARPCWPSACPACCPALDDDVALEVTAVHSVAGLLPPARPARPTTAVAGAASHRIGGGLGGRRIGHRLRRARSRLAHGGVLFLDEAAEFSPAVLEALRQPIESGQIVLHRSGGAVVLPGPVPARAGRQRVPMRAAGPAV